MFDTDTVYFQNKTTSNFNGVEVNSWTESGNSVLCDVQDISTEYAIKSYGFTDSSEFKQVFDKSQSQYWELGSQVKFEGIQYLVRLVRRQTKILASNHTFIVLSRVI